MNKELFDYLTESLDEMEKHAKGNVFLPTTVFKLDSNGKKRMWKIWVDNLDQLNPPIARINIESGLVDGEKVPQSIEIREGKNLGKSNATTPYTQAIAEAEAKLELQLRKGYVENLDEVKESGTLRSGIKEPMTAHKYDPEGKQSSSKTLDKMKLRGKKIFVQPKLDGQRCLIKLFSEKVGDGEGVINSKLTGTMYTRKGDVRRVQFTHIIDELNQWFGEISTVGDEVVLDGELFSSELSFNEANGILNKKKLTDEEWEKAKKIKFHLYDAQLDVPYNERYDYIKTFAKDTKYVELIPNYEIEATDENIREKLEEFLAEGNEGLMIRRLDTPYEYKRTWQLVKCKLFEDAEFEIVDMEANSMGRLGGVIVKLPEPVTDRDGKILTTVTAGLGKGIDHETGLELLRNKEKYVGKMATVEYFGWDIRPRFPKFKSVRND